MNITGLFHPLGLLIWVPGLLFLLSVLLVLARSPQGRATRGLYLATLAFFLIGLLTLILVPKLQIDDAVAYANAYAPDNPVSRYADIGFDAKSAYFRTALPPEERVEQAATRDIFSFGEPAAAGVAVVRDTATMDAIVYKPEHSTAWLLLLCLMIPGMLGILQDPKGFLAGWKQRGS